MIKYWEFKVEHVDGGTEYINPVLTITPRSEHSNILIVFNGHYHYEYSIAEIKEWSFYPVKEDKDE